MPDAPIDIDRLTEAELIDLNHRVVERLRFIRQARAHVAMLRFRIGDRVTFEPDLRGPIHGIIVRYNKKSVSVLTEDGQRWTVAPGLLRRADDGARESSGPDNDTLLLPGS
ncbi:hypothetical protein [Rhodanobacter lindaniclasticus]